MNRYIIVAVDGASNIKLEVLEFETLTTVASFTTRTPITRKNGLDYNESIAELDWFAEKIAALPTKIRNSIEAIIPAARGASGALISGQNQILDSPDHNLTLAYTNRYPETVEAKFKALCGNAEKLYRETGAILAMPGSLTLIKRLLFEEMERPKLLKQAEGFATYNILMAGYFAAKDYLTAIKKAGNEHTYWMCHTGARNINAIPGTSSYLAKKISGFNALIPAQPSLPTTIVGTTTDNIPVIAGGHDTALSHLPIISSFRQQHPHKSLIHVEAGSWTMCAKIGPFTDLPKQGYNRGILVQGTIDGEPVVTTNYGGGFDFRYLKQLVEKQQQTFIQPFNPELLEKIVTEKKCFVLPNINPKIHGSGPFPNLKGKIINETEFFNLPPGSQHIIANLTIAFVISTQIKSICNDNETPIILTAGGAKDPYLGSLLSSLTNNKIFIAHTKDNEILTESTTLGTAIVAKSALLNLHPYQTELPSNTISYHETPSLPAKLQAEIKSYANELMKLCC